MLVLGVTSAHELDRLMELDIEVHRRGRSEPVSALHAAADALVDRRHGARRGDHHAGHRGCAGNG